MMTRRPLMRRVRRNLDAHNWWNQLPTPWLLKFNRDTGKAIVLAFRALVRA